MKDKPMENKNPTIQSILEYLAKDTIHPEKVDLWPTLQANLAASKTLLQPKELSMNKRFIFTALAAVLILLSVAVFTANTVTTVSAKEILDRAYEAQSTQNEGEGIQHTRIETYQNLCARAEGAGITTATQSYFDPQSGYFRTITTEAATENVLEVLAFDGAHVYEGHRSIEVKSDQPEQGTGPGPRHVVCDQPWGDTTDVLTVYRSSQSSVASVNLPTSESMQTHEDLFQQMHKDPNAELLGEETWIDGRTVYVLRSRQPVKAIVEGSAELPMGWVVSYFDAESYKIVESRATMDKDGQELLVYSYRVLADEILPVGSPIPWGLSDLQNITIVDDPDGQYVSLLPEVISEQQLASQSESAYLLKNIPDGFILEISVSPKQAAEEPFFYVASYRNEANDYFVIQSIGAKDIKLMEEGSSESYTTNSGLNVTFMDNTKDASGKLFTSAVVETPEGTAFILSSTLSSEQVKALAEELVLVSK